MSDPSDRLSERGSSEDEDEDGVEIDDDGLSFIDQMEENKANDLNTDERHAQAVAFMTNQSDVPPTRGTATGRRSKTRKSKPMTAAFFVCATLVVLVCFCLAHALICLHFQ